MCVVCARRLVCRNWCLPATNITNEFGFHLRWNVLGRTSSRHAGAGVYELWNNDDNNNERRATFVSVCIVYFT